MVTSIITKVRPDDHIRATLAFKTWEEVNAHYRQSLVDASEAQLKMARSAAQACRDYGQRHQIDNAFSKSCEDWLKTDPR